MRPKSKEYNLRIIILFFLFLFSFYRNLTVYHDFHMIADSTTILKYSHMIVSRATDNFFHYQRI